ncbi:hypothetical protein [Streptomyces sp. NPDC056296]|uniref:hypothetical protein n=1 Tax=Streptomyces sp. NPDC056296 TaxID=3345775 RepID=UPI0035D7C0DA
MSPAQYPAPPQQHSFFHVSQYGSSLPQPLGAERRLRRSFLRVNVTACVLIACLSLGAATWPARAVMGELPLGMLLFALQGAVLLATAWRFERHSRRAGAGDHQRRAEAHGAGSDR